MNNILKIFYNHRLLGLIIKSDYSAEGINFLTDDKNTLQLAYMHHQAGYVIKPHYHNNIKRIISDTQEVIFIKKGRIKVNFYNNEQVLIENHILTDGDILLLVAGGHGFEALEETEMVEVKQGPYTGEKDKTRFIPKQSYDNE